MGMDWTTIIEGFGTIAVLAIVGGPPFYFAARAERRRRNPAARDLLDSVDELVLAIAGAPPLAPARRTRRSVSARRA